MYIIALIFSILITIFFPMLSIIPNLINFLLFKKARKIYAFLTALSFGLIAYTWNPETSYDLYRWQQEMQYFSYSNFSTLISTIANNLEPLNYMIKYYISKTGNFDLVQFFISFIGYFEILWMIADYSKKKNINFSAVVITTIFILLSLQYISFISGLWFNFAIINFALGIYLDYVKNTKCIQWIFYLISIFTHISTLYLLILLIIIKLINLKNYEMVILTTFLVSLLLGPILMFLDGHVNLYTVHYVYNLYNSYFIMGDRFDYLHSGTNLIYAIIRLILTIIIIYYEKNKIKSYSNKYIMFIVIVSTSIVAILFHAKVFIRFIFFVQLISIPLLLNFFSGKLNNRKFIIITIILMFNILLLRGQYIQLKSANMLKCIDNNLFNNIFYLENGWSE